MEADSTTFENTNHENSKYTTCFPFSISPGNFKLYQNFVNDDGEKYFQMPNIEILQQFGLLPTSVKCSTSQTGCRVVCKIARVIDRVQWICEGCGKKQPIRIGSFFYKLQCSIQQVLEMILAWCEDADLNIAAQHFNVKTRAAISIYDRLDELAIKELKKCKLGGENSVVLAELYPDCLNRLSPDTTDQPHTHRILMLADTKHIPTYYRLHVLRKESATPESSNPEDEILKSEVEMALAEMTESQSTVVLGNNLPSIDGCTTYQHLVQHCDIDMQRFLCTRVWRQALSICTASRDLCAGASATCALTVQRYLDISLYRLRYGDGFYDHVLKTVCAEFTEKFN